MENRIIISNDYQNIKSAASLAAGATRQLGAINPLNWKALLGLPGKAKRHCSHHGVNCPRFTPSNHAQIQQGERL